MPNRFNFEDPPLTCYAAVEIGEHSDGSSYVGRQTIEYKLPFSVFNSDLLDPKLTNQQIVDDQKIFRASFLEDQKANVTKFLCEMLSAPGFEFRVLAYDPKLRVNKYMSFILKECTITNIDSPVLAQSLLNGVDKMIVKCTITFESSTRMSELSDEDLSIYKYDYIT